LRSQPTVRLASVATAFPAHKVSAGDTVESLARLFPAEQRGFLEELVARSGVRERRIALPLEETLAERSFTERNAAWREVALDLAHRAARSAIDRAGIDAARIDDLIDVSCTGIAIPALDVDLAPALGLRPEVRRVPITESGCAAGALALSLAGDLVRGGRRVLIVAVELCSLTLVCGDVSRTNLVASLLFGDGAAAAVLGPDGGGPRLVAAGSHLLPDTRSMMGFEVGEHGLRIVLQRELPAVLAEHLRPAVDAFLARNGREIGDVGLHLVHPGGRRILDAYAEIFALPAGALALSHESLTGHGNLSSASILAVLEAALEGGVRPPKGRLALVLGVGPGLSLELSLWSWD
jgi:alkylresorcinol/alkylpyrone synthase